jgi:hypothetical protein
MGLVSVWSDLGIGGDSYAGLPYQSGWDSSREQPSMQGAYTIYPGGDQALAARAPPLNLDTSRPPGEQ